MIDVGEFDLLAVIFINITGGANPDNALPVFHDGKAIIARKRLSGKWIFGEMDHSVFRRIVHDTSAGLGEHPYPAITVLVNAGDLIEERRFGG
jgi:hypothetical protein